MEDEELNLSNTCTDLVSLKKWEVFPLRLLKDKRAGEWMSVFDLCRELKLDVGHPEAGLFVTWLPDPLGNDAYAVIIFYDNDSEWTMAAHYNRSRILGQPLPLPWQEAILRIQDSKREHP